MILYFYGCWHRLCGLLSESLCNEHKRYCINDYAGAKYVCVLEIYTLNSAIILRTLIRLSLVAIDISRALLYYYEGAPGSGSSSIAQYPLRNRIFFFKTAGQQEQPHRDKKYFFVIKFFFIQNVFCNTDAVS